MVGVVAQQTSGAWPQREGLSGGAGSSSAPVAGRKCAGCTVLRPPFVPFRNRNCGGNLVQLLLLRKGLQTARILLPFPFLRSSRKVKGRSVNRPTSRTPNPRPHGRHYSTDSFVKALFGVRLCGWLSPK